ncbi:heterokaryon incompatibility protein-domain-containing protein, partial [Lophiotrema nucula]
CINQQDVEEKNIQVPLMTDIYSRAAFVVTYMGPEEPDNKEGFALLERLKEFYNRRRSDTALGSLVLHDYRLEDLGLPPSDDPSWASLRKILLRPWSSRVWIVQNFVVNEINYLVCGRTSMTLWENPLSCHLCDS